VTWPPRPTRSPSPPSRVPCLVDQYAAAFESADPAALRKLLHKDATLEATPFRTWFAGSANCVPFLRAFVLGEPGDWCMFPTTANGHPALAAYRRSGQAHQAYGIVTFSTRPGTITQVICFDDPSLLPVFGFPSTPDPITVRPE
jgi:RNA polymerase sigma-70 factor (ECF subfamily)